jgi:hypothetical protein
MDERRVFELAKKVANCEKVNNMLVESIQTLSEAYNMLASEMDCFKKNIIYEATKREIRSYMTSGAREEHMGLLDLHRTSGS